MLLGFIKLYKGMGSWIFSTCTMFFTLLLFFYHLRSILLTYHYEPLLDMQELHAWEQTSKPHWKVKTILLPVDNFYRHLFKKSICLYFAYIAYPLRRFLVLHSSNIDNIWVLTISLIWVFLLVSWKVGAS